MTYEFIMEGKLGIKKKNKYWRTGQRMSLKLYSPALTRTAGEKTRQTLSNAYAAILPHPFTLGLSHSEWNSYTVTDTENDKTDISGLLQSSFTVTSLMYPWELWHSPGDGLRSPPAHKTNTRACIPLDRIQHHGHNNFQITHGYAESRL